MKYIDCHVHITPRYLLSKESLELYALGKREEEAENARRVVEDPDALVKILDDANVEKAFLVSNVSPKVEGIPYEINDFTTRYCAKHPERLIPFGSLHPRDTDNARKDMDHLVDDLGVKGIKIHPCHQLVYPNEYRTGKLRSLEQIYSCAQEKKVPVMFHTGTSVFKKARNIYGDPIYVDDVAVDFPDLKIILAHGGRPLWTDTAFFLVRRHKNVYMDISGIPPSHLLSYFPRLELVAAKTMFGSDWAGPMVSSIRANIQAFLNLPLPATIKQQVLRETALGLLKA